MWNFKFVAIAVLLQTVNCQVYAQQLQNQNQNIQYQPAVQFQPGQNNVNQQAYQNGQQQQQQQPNPQAFQQQQQNSQVFQQQQQQQQPQQQIQSNSQQGTPVAASSNQVLHYSMPGTNFVNNYQSQAGAGPNGVQTSQMNVGQLASGSAQNPFITQNEIPSDTTKPFSFNYGHQGPGFLSMLLGSMGIHVGGGGRNRGPPKPGQGKPRPNGPGGSPGAHGSHGSHGPQGPHGPPPSSPPTHVGNHLQAVQGLAQQQHIQLSQQSSGGINGPIQYSGSVINSSPFTPYTSSGNNNGGSGNLHYFESPQQIQAFQQQQPLQSQTQPQFIQNQNQNQYQHHQHQQVNPFPSYTSALSDVKYPAPPSPLSAYSSDFPQNSPVSDGSEGAVSIIDGSVFSGSKVMKYTQQSDPEVLSYSKHQQHNPKHPNVRVKYEESEPEFSYAHTQEPGGHGHHGHGNSGSTKSKDSHYEPTHAHTLESSPNSPHSNDDDMKPYTIIEKPVVHYIDKPVVRFIEKTVVRTVEKPVIKYVEKPVIQYKYVQMNNPTPSHLKNFNSGPLNPSYNNGYQSNSINVGKEGEAYESDDQMQYTGMKTEGEGAEMVDSSESGEEGFKAPTIKIIHHYHTQSMDSPQNMEPQKVAHHQNSPGGSGPHIGSGENKDNSEFYSSYGGAYYRKNAVKIPAKTIGLKDDEKLEANFDDNAFKTPLIHIPKELPAYAPQGGKYEIIKTHIYGPSVSSLHGQNHQGHGQQQVHLVQSNSSPVGQVQMMSTSASTANTATTVAVPLPVEAREQFLVKK